MSPTGPDQKPLDYAPRLRIVRDPPPDLWDYDDDSEGELINDHGCSLRVAFCIAAIMWIAMIYAVVKLV